MPQELRVVRCFQCLKYQVDIVKKANKWACKMCGAKQSLAREYFRGTGQDCRSMVQQLSVRHLEMDQREAEVAELVLQNKIKLPQPTQLDSAMLRNGTNESTNTTSKGPSKWAAFLTKEENNDPSDALDPSESLESVSCTTFDRERIGCPVKQSNAWSNYPTVQHDSSDSDAQLALNMDDISPRDFSSNGIWKLNKRIPYSTQIVPSRERNVIQHDFRTMVLKKAGLKLQGLAPCNCRTFIVKEAVTIVHLKIDRERCQNHQRPMLPHRLLVTNHRKCHVKESVQKQVPQRRS
ncbi:uncharacterized protein LOC121602278 [Anopheles merus]|uniref:uncharacterized protein LOC121602278 n=1 Tax=Anopheles merus TaxID=30066 RepID=UPI001BE494F8|nr:uncharacterized protein LOC121602278 [Anopheles merus]